MTNPSSKMSKFQAGDNIPGQGPTESCVPKAAREKSPPNPTSKRFRQRRLHGELQRPAGAGYSFPLLPGMLSPANLRQSSGLNREAA
jgi:hypothetical protein